MSELLTAKDVELKIFKKVSFGGYSISDVEEFLNQIAEDLESYVLRLNEQQRRVNELEEALKRHEAMKDTIKDALILAQQSAKDKEEEARRQAERILAKAEAKIGEIDDEGHRRLEEAENKADEMVAEARAAAAQIIKSAEEKKEEAEKRLENIELEISRHMEKANEKADAIAASARIEAKRAAGKVRYEIEEYKREMSALIVEKRNFLRDSEALASDFTRTIEEAIKTMDKDLAGGHEYLKHEPVKSDADRVTLSFFPGDDSSLDKEAAIS
jgi:cell division initiation protein